MGYQRATPTRIVETTARLKASAFTRPWLPAHSPGLPIQRLQRTLGNQAFGDFVQAQLKINQPGDVYEQEADRVADHVMRMPDGEAPAPAPGPAMIQRQCAACAGRPGPCPECAKTDEVQRKPRALAIKQAPGEMLRTRAVSSPPPKNISDQIVQGVRGGGKPLPDAVRAFFEPRFEADFSQVRVHTDARAAMSARAVNARAFTMGHNIVFGAEEFAPGRSAGNALLAHELTHTLQQRAVSHRSQVLRQAPVIQRQPAESEGASEITAQDVFPFPQESRVLLGRILSDLFFRILSASDPETAAALRAIDRQEATVTTASEDLFEARLTESVTIPAQGERPARTLRNIIFSLRRSGGTFTFDLTAQEGESTSPTSLMTYRDLTASRDRGGIVLSSGSGEELQPQLLVTPTESGGVQLEIFKSNFIDQIPEWARGLVPETIEAIGINRLPDAATDAEVQRATEAIVARQASRRRVRRQEISLGGGTQFTGGDVSPLLFTSWQIHFPTTNILGPVAGQFVRVPLEVQFQYAPPSSVLGGVSTGVEARIPTSVPINIRLVAGVAGGRLEVPVGEESEGRGAFGPTLGAAAGIELGIWRVNVRYEHLFNLVENSPNVHSVFASGGVAF